MKRLQMLVFGVLLASLAGPAVRAAEPREPRESTQSIRNAVGSFLARESLNLPGQVETRIGPIEERLALPACPQLDVSLPSGVRLWGRAAVTVRCPGANGWTIAVPVEVRVTGQYLVAARPLASGQGLGPDDYSVRRGELTRLPGNPVLDPAQLAGKVLAYGLAGGEALRGGMLRAPLTVLSNQPVRVVTRGRGFVITGEGRALANGSDGQTVQVRTASGQVVAGIVRPGPLVEVF